MSGSVSYAHQSPPKDGSPAQLSRPTPFDAQRTPASVTSQDVASHPIVIGNASSPTPVTPRPLLLHHDVDPSPLCQGPEQGADLQQPWHLETPSMMQTGGGCIGTVSQLGLGSLEGASSAAHLPPAAAQDSMSADQLLPGTREEMHCGAVPSAARDELAELAVLRESISSGGARTQSPRAGDKQRYEASPSHRCNSSYAANTHSADNDSGADATIQEPIEQSHGVNGGKRVCLSPAFRAPAGSSERCRMPRKQCLASS